jgi:hypothetical protein
MYSMDTWSILRSFVICYLHFVIVHGNLIYFFPFWYFVPRKIWQPREEPKTLHLNVATQFHDVKVRFLSCFRFRLHFFTFLLLLLSFFAVIFLR